jgi:hypothetical protein
LAPLVTPPWRESMAKKEKKDEENALRPAAPFRHYAQE